MTVARTNGLNVHIYPSPFEYETRILKVTRSMVSNGIVDRVLIVATAKHGSPQRETLDVQRDVVRVGVPMNGGGILRKTMQFLKWSSQVMILLNREPITLVNCHSLSVLPLCVALARRHSATLIYEPHELETETATSRGIRRIVAKWLERILIIFASQVFVVSESIAAHYRKDYRLSNVTVVMNCPESVSTKTNQPNRLLRDRFAIKDSDIVILYQGMFSEPRGVHLILDAFRDLPADRHLVLMGFGPLEAAIHSATSVHTNIHLHPPVRPDDVGIYSLGADIGITLLSDDCENHNCALPNKLFQYLSAGLPVITSDLKEMRRIVKQYECGWTVAYQKESISRTIAEITHQEILMRKTGARRAGDNLTWRHEEAKIVSVYGSLMSSGQ